MTIVQIKRIGIVRKSLLEENMAKTVVSSLMEALVDVDMFITH